MVALKSVLLKGVINQTLTYPLSLVLPIREGEWHISLASVSLQYHSKAQHPAPIPRTILKVTSNYVTTQDVNSRNEVIASPAILSVFRIGGEHDACTTIGFRNRDFFTVNSAEPNLKINLQTVNTNEYTTGADVFLLVVLKRVR